MRLFENAQTREKESQNGTHRDPRGDQGGTFGGQPLAMTAAYTVIKHMLDKNIPDRARRRGNYLKKKLRKLAAEAGLTNVRGTGLLVAVDLPHDQGAAVVSNAFDNGLLIKYRT